MAKLTKKQKQQELASIKVWTDINKSLVAKYPRVEEIEMDEFEVKIREMVAESSWEALYLKLTEKSISSLAKSGSKMEKCVDIYVNMIDQPNVRRIHIINAMMSQEGISKEHASTYFQTIKKRLKESTGE